MKGKVSGETEGPESLDELGTWSLSTRLVERLKGKLLRAAERREPAYFRPRPPQATGNDPMGARAYPSDRPPALDQESPAVGIAPPAAPAGS